MLYHEIFKILSAYLFSYAAILLLPLLLAIYYQFFAIEHPQPHSTAAFGLTILVCVLLAIIFWLLARKAKGNLYRREALATAVLIWFITPLIGGLPFFFSGTLERFDQAYFEATSGFTTTGSTVFEAKQYDPTTYQEIPIKRTYCGMLETTYEFYGTIKPVINSQTGEQLEGLDAVSRALLFWRSLTQWLGGMGIILLFITILPAFGVGEKMLVQTETPGPLKEGLTPRLKETALQLWQIYLGLTFMQIVLLLLTNQEMSLFDALTISFSTVSTGGFSVRNNNIAFYHHAATEWVILIFMILGSINFALYYQILKGKFYRIFEPEFLCYLSTLIGSGLFITWYLIGLQTISLAGEPTGIYSACQALRTGFFQLISAQTSTGFFTANYDTWPHITQALMLISMYLGGMSGSTAGGIKIIRIYLLCQIAKHKVESIFQPKAIRIIRLGSKEVSADASFSVLCFFFLAIVLSTGGVFLYIWDHIDLETALGLMASMINNSGLAFRAAGPTSSAAFLSPFSAYVSAFAMILGRLEFYAVLVVLIPAFWKKNM